MEYCNLARVMGKLTNSDYIFKRLQNADPVALRADGLEVVR